MTTQRDDKNGKAKSAALKIRVFGAPEITLNETPVAGLTLSKAQALLFYLAVTGRNHARPALAALLWGDLPEAAARSNLRRVLHQLRQHLATFLVIERDMVALVEDADCWVDAVEFDAMLAEGPAPPLPDGLQRAADLYRGDLLEGFYVRNAPDFEDWWLGERGRLRELMLSGLRTLADHHAHEGNLDEAIALTRRSLELEPWHEAAHRRLMTWLALSGQRSAALAQYKVCRRVLADELDVEPTEETDALYDRIRKGNLGPHAPARIQAVEIQPQPPAFLDQEVESAPGSPEPFVERDPELSRLAGFLETALAGQGQIAVVSGEAGWGKTRLLSEFARRAQEGHPNLIVAYGTCTAFTETGDPYLPFREILRMLCADVDQAWAAGRVTRDHALRLWRFMPRMVEALLTKGRRLIDAFVPGDALLQRAAAHESVASDLLKELQQVLLRDQARQQSTSIEQERIFEQVADLLQTVSRHQPLLLVLDDLHWADISSLGLLFHLSRRITESQILVLGAYRPEDISLGRRGQEHPLTGILAELGRLSGDVWVKLGQDEGEGRGFVDALLDSEPNRLSENFRAKLAQYTKGHPLFAVEMLRDLKDQAHLVQDERSRWVDRPTINWDALPRRVEGVLERRINRLAPEQRGVLVAASVEGEEFTAEVVAQVRKVSDSAMVNLLSGDLTKQHHLVGASGARRLGRRRISRYRFGHNLFQKYLYGTLDPVERAYLHEAVGDALEGLYHGHTQEAAIHLARHFQEAGRLGKAVEYLQQAGDTAARVYANAEAIAHYRQALDLAREIEADVGALTLLYMHLGRALELDSRFEQALAVYEEMESVALEHGDRPMELASLMAQVTIQAVPTAIHDPIRAQALGEWALDLACELGDQAAQAKILWNLALAYYLDHRMAQAIESGERSLALAREHNLREQMAQTLNDLGSFCYMYSGQIEKAKGALQEASLLWRELDNLPMLADSLASAAIAHVYVGEFEQAITLSEQAYEISLSIENLWGQSYSFWKVGLAHWERGDWSQAISTMERSVRLGELANFLPPQANTRAELAALYGELGAIERGLDLARLALQVAEAQNPAQVGHGLGVLAQLQILAGDVAEAQAAIDRAKADPYRASWPVMFHSVAIAEAELALREGEWQQALEVAEDLLRELRQSGMRLRVADSLYLQAQALQGLGQDQIGRDRLLEARAEAEAIGSRRTLWRTFRALSQLESDPGEAKRLRGQAQEVVEYIADHIQEANLRDSFLSLPDVRAVLEMVERG